ncbi:MAG TPA: nicotinate phosphoribosyltransferase [Thermoanaerobaculia bacterium]|jgi:nicotinate phosphoribosyltransferase|nr:nicotinate phosphoribosyltransferase [Thermoanaerobaculia bacterium]
MPSFALLTDLYELTMAYGYWRGGKARDEAVFHLFFRKEPFGGGYAIAAGLAEAIRYLRTLAFGQDDLGYLSSLTGNDGAPLFPEDFLRWLGALRFRCDVDALPEGSVVFAHEPLLRVRGPIAEAQLVETALLNILNFQTLIATKAARIVHAAAGDAVIDFGLRRAQGENGALSAARAAYIGGVGATSNVLAGARYGIPVKGTHAHSWVMSFDDELEAFQTYAEVMPNNALLLVDTYDTLQGVRHAIEIGRRLRERGHELAGIRLDSGDLSYLSIEARKMLDGAGFEKAVIAASNDLDEHLITSLKEQGAKISLWGVGTRLVTAWDQPALGGVYKLSAMRRQGGAWEHRIKVSEQTAKVSTPGILQVRRFDEEGEAAGDMIWDELDGGPGQLMIDPFDPTRRKSFAGQGRDLLVPIFRNGELVYEGPSLQEASAHRERELSAFHPGVKRFANPHRYPVGLESRLFERRTKLIMQGRK